MTRRTNANVSDAFEVLQEEVEAEIELTNREGAQAFERGSHDQARAALERVDRLVTLRGKIVALRREWEALSGQAVRAKAEPLQRSSRRSYGKLKKGAKTPEAAYYRPILQALVDLGGSASMRDVLSRVEPMVKGMLKPIDYERMPSDPDQIRWRNTAQWARYAMVQEGLLRDDSPRGTWEITEQGRAWLAANR